MTKYTRAQVVTATLRGQEFECTARLLFRMALRTSLRKTIRPDALLLDIAMTHLNGLQIAEEFKRRPEIRPKHHIAVTGYSNLLMRNKIPDAGFDHHLVKPVNTDDLNAAISSEVAHASP